MNNLDLFRVLVVVVLQKTLLKSTKKTLKKQKVRTNQKPENTKQPEIETETQTANFASHIAADRFVANISEGTAAQKSSEYPLTFSLYLSFCLSVSLPLSLSL